MTLLETLVVGSYVWSFLLAGALYRKLQVIETNHLAHLEKEILKLRRHRLWRKRALQKKRAR